MALRLQCEEEVLARGKSSKHLVNAADSGVKQGGRYGCAAAELLGHDGDLLGGAGGGASRCTSLRGQRHREAIYF